MGKVSSVKILFLKATRKMVDNRSLNCCTYKPKFQLLGPDAACHNFPLGHDWEKLLALENSISVWKKKNKTPTSNTLRIISELSTF
jgi:hypothetical protein